MERGSHPDPCRITLEFWISREQVRVTHDAIERQLSGARVHERLGSRLDALAGLRVLHAVDIVALDMHREIAGLQAPLGVLGMAPEPADHVRLAGLLEIPIGGVPYLLPRCATGLHLLC